MIKAKTQFLWYFGMKFTYFPLNRYFHIILIASAIIDDINKTVSSSKSIRRIRLRDSEFDKTTSKDALIRGIGISFNKVVLEDNEYYDLFTDPNEVIKERKLEQTINSLKTKFGKNSIIKAMNLDEGATTIKRNKLIGGHNAETEDAD